MQDLAQQNPLAAGGVGLALGAAIGLALPETSREDQVLGQARDKVMGQAQAVTQDTMEKVKRVAEETQTTVQEKAQEQGLTT